MLGQGTFDKTHLQNKECTREENEFFENLLFNFETEPPDSSEKTASQVTWKTPEQTQHQYEALVEKLKLIGSASFPQPQHGEDKQDMRKDERSDGRARRGGHVANMVRGIQVAQQRRKWIPWTEDEHRLFLAGLKQYGKGNWKSISKNYVRSRTPTQVASHAQKFFNRLNSSKTKGGRRPSIHDIREINGPLPVPPINSSITYEMSYNNQIPRIGHTIQGQAPNMSIVGRSEPVYPLCPSYRYKYYEMFEKYLSNHRRHLSGSYSSSSKMNPKSGLETLHLSGSYSSSSKMNPKSGLETLQPSGYGAGSSRHGPSN